MWQHTFFVEPWLKNQHSITLSHCIDAESSTSTFQSDNWEVSTTSFLVLVLKYVLYHGLFVWSDMKTWLQALVFFALATGWLRIDQYWHRFITLTHSYFTFLTCQLALSISSMRWWKGSVYILLRGETLTQKDTNDKPRVKENIFSGEIMLFVFISNNLPNSTWNELHVCLLKHVAKN